MFAHYIANNMGHRSVNVALLTAVMSYWNMSSLMCLCLKGVMVIVSLGVAVGVTVGILMLVLVLVYQRRLLTYLLIISIDSIRRNRLEGNLLFL